MTRYILGGQKDSALHNQALEAWKKSVRLRPEQPKIVDLISRYQRM